MEKKILIPTDFTIESLMLVKLAALNTPDKLHIMLMYCYQSHNSISDLLFFSPDKVLKSVVSSQFNDACHVLQNKYSSRILSFNTVIFNRNTKNAFERFAEHLKVQEIYIPKTYSFKIRENNFDALPLIKKSRFITHEVDWVSQPDFPEKGTLAELFMN